MTEDKQTMIILTGNIGCGKSTVAGWLMQEYEGRKIVTVSNDSITMMTGNGDYSRYQPRLNDMYRGMFISCVCLAIDAGATVICDNSHMTVFSRRELIQIAKDAGIPVTSVDMGQGSPESLKRRQEAPDGRGTANSVWCHVHNKFKSEYEAPSTKEGFLGVVSGDEIWEIIG